MDLDSKILLNMAINNTEKSVNAEHNDFEDKVMLRYRKYKEIHKKAEKVV